MLKVVVCLLTKEFVICMQGQTRLSPLSPQETHISIAVHTHTQWHIWHDQTQADRDLDKTGKSLSFRLSCTHLKPYVIRQMGLPKTSGCLHQLMAYTECLRCDDPFFIWIPHKLSVFIFRKLTKICAKLKLIWYSWCLIKKKETSPKNLIFTFLMRCI